MMSPRWGYCVFPSDEGCPKGGVGFFFSSLCRPDGAIARRAKPRRLCTIHLGQLLVERSRDDSVRYTWGVCSSSEAETTLFNTLGAIARRAKPRRESTIYNSPPRLRSVCTRLRLVSTGLRLVSTRLRSVSTRLRSVSTRFRSVCTQL